MLAPLGEDSKMEIFFMWL